MNHFIDLYLFQYICDSTSVQQMIINHLVHIREIDWLQQGEQSIDSLSLYFLHGLLDLVEGDKCECIGKESSFLLRKVRIIEKFIPFLMVFA